MYFWSHLAQFVLEWEMFQTNVVVKIKTRILCSTVFFIRSCRLWDVGKYGRARQATDGSTVHALCTLDYQDFYFNWSHPDVFSRQYSKSKFSQNTTNLLSIINMATCFDSQSHHQANYWTMFEVQQVKVHTFGIPKYLQQ